VLLAAILAVGMSAAPAAAADSASSGPAAVENIVQRFAVDSGGVMVQRQRIVYIQTGGGAIRRNEQELGVLLDDRKTVAMRAVRVSIDGRDQDGVELAGSQATLDRQLAGPPRIVARFALPVFPEAVAEYRFSPTVQPCSGCSSGGQAIAFSSAVKDERHGHGTLLFDPVTWRPIAIEFEPNVFAEPAIGGQLTFTFGSFDDGSWGVVRTAVHYTTEITGIAGTADLVTTVLHAKHYSTLEEGRRALRAP
jgi:hypothetical protein